MCEDRWRLINLQSTVGVLLASMLLVGLNAAAAEDSGQQGGPPAGILQMETPAAGSLRAPLGWLDP